MDASGSFKNYAFKLWDFRLEILISGRIAKKNCLVTDHQDMSRKVQVAGKRYEAYQFHRELFYSPGTVDIAELGKEDIDV